MEQPMNVKRTAYKLLALSNDINAVRRGRVGRRLARRVYGRTTGRLARRILRMNVTYPDVEVELIGHDGNAIGIIGKVSRAIRRAHGHDAGTDFVNQATQCGSYDELLALVMRTVEVS
jgi:hypothetical protein